MTYRWIARPCTLWMREARRQIARVALNRQLTPSPLPSAAAVEAARVAAAPRPAPESADARLAKNLVAARMLAGMTQHRLAEASGVSRATIAQLETGYSDPRLSTIVQLAQAMGVSPILLLIGAEEARALARLRGAGSGFVVPTHDLAKMIEYVESGMLKDRLRAARVGAAVARRAAAESSTPAASASAGAIGGSGPIVAGILSAWMPGAGTVAGAALGELLAPLPAATDAASNQR